MAKIVLKKPFTAEDNLLIFFDFLQLTAVIVQIANKFFIENNVKRKAERRVFLVKGEMSHYKISVQTY